MKVIQLRQADATPLLINADALVFAQPAGSGTLVGLAGGTTFTVLDSFEAVAELVDPERQAAEHC